jgi:hypothetical protein
MIHDSPRLGVIDDQDTLDSVSGDLSEARVKLDAARKELE